ncbi:MAG: M28 family metallopeptidase [candidate division KSB1 bacterium]|nr:M28 family metallopeptidase [candidate division KSB1 bacterium]
MKRTGVVCAALLLALWANAFAQFFPWQQTTLLEDSVLDRFIDECSGERAMRHVLAMAGSERNRPPSEYQDTFLEAAYVLEQARAIGFDSVAIEYFPADSIWDGEEGELWEIAPRRRKLADYNELTAFLATGSQSIDTTAELVYVGRGTSERDYEGKEVEGKIVLGYGPTGALHGMAVERFGALGVVSFASLHPLDDPDQVAWMGIGGRRRSRGFAFNLGVRQGMELRDRLERGEKIRVRVHVRSAYRAYRHNVVTALIRGRQPQLGYVILSAHLFEGIAKQGANDNISGSACLLEIGRTLLSLMGQGAIERPRRSILFLWVPEFSGTIPWVDAHYDDVVRRALVNLNLDMEGAWLSRHRSFYNLERTPFSRPSYLNDVMQSLFEFVAETNRESIHSRQFRRPIVAPSGSRDPFYYQIEYHYGASDHEVFNDWGVGVPGVMPITWPDLGYHSSADRPDRMDPTQLKRAVFINAVAAFLVANADRKMALRIAGEVFSNGLGRIGREYQRAAEMLEFAPPHELGATYGRAENVVSVSLDLEQRTLRSIEDLCPGDAVVASRIRQLTRKIAANVGPAVLSDLWERYTILCEAKGVEPARPGLTSAEKEAAQIVPVPTAKVHGFFRREWIVDSVPPAVRDSLATIAPEKTQELRRLIDGKRSALEIRNVLDAEFASPTEMDDVLRYLQLLEKAGLVELKRR